MPQLDPTQQQKGDQLDASVQTTHARTAATDVTRDLPSITHDLTNAVQSGSRSDLQAAMQSLNKAAPSSPNAHATTTNATSESGLLYNKVHDLMNQYLKGNLPQSELVRQLKNVNNQLAHNMVKDAKKALGGSTALATSPEHQSQLPQSRSLLEDSATNVKAAGVEESGPPPPEKAESAYGAMGDDGALSTDNDHRQEERREQQETERQILDAAIVDREVNEQVQVQQINQIVEQNRRVAQDKQRQMQEAQQDSETQEIAGQRGGIAEFMRTASGTSSQKEKYLQRSRSRASVGNIPRIDKELAHSSRGQEQSLVQSTRDSAKGKEGAVEEQSAEHEETPVEEHEVPLWFRPVEAKKL